MTNVKADDNTQEVCHLEWFINSRCDYACKGCTAKTSAKDKPDIGLDARMEALESLVAFAAERGSDASIMFYPRQAEFTKPFVSILKHAGILKTKGVVKRIACANRGDLPSHKIELYRDCGVDACHLTMDGPEAIQDPLRRQGSFRDTLKAFRETRENGMLVVPLVILAEHNAPHLAETMKQILDEGFDECQIKVRARGDVHGGDTRADDHPDPESPWNHLLTAGGYRAVLLDALNFLDTVATRHGGLRAKFILANQMYARLFFELGRLEEYEQLVAHEPNEVNLQFMLKPDGAVHYQSHMPAMGAFPGGSFKTMYESSHPMRWFKQRTSWDAYMTGKQKEFAKCRSCPAAPYCRPTLIAEQGQRLFYHPDTHCWVD